MSSLTCVAYFVRGHVHKLCGVMYILHYLSTLGLSPVFHVVESRVEITFLIAANACNSTMSLPVMIMDGSISFFYTDNFTYSKTKRSLSGGNGIKKGRNEVSTSFK